MRETNFSIPNVNKASVGITTALYDRRALDCTSTLPLINSLNHLAYLTTSSARIRDILTVDGGVERLVCILKQGRSQEMMEMWKWNLAFQCVVNIGIRGSETVRTRVVEADMVPVIATILDNYIKVVDMYREQAEADTRRQIQQQQKREQQEQQRQTRAVIRNPKGPSDRSSFQDRGNISSENRPFRRNDPPPAIEIPHPFTQMAHHQHTTESPLIDAQVARVSPPQRIAPIHHHHRHHPHHHHRSQDIRHHAQNSVVATNRSTVANVVSPSVTSMDTADGFALRPVRDVDRLPSMLPSLQAGIMSQPESPTTPNAPTARSLIESTQSRRRSSVRHHQSGSGDSDDGNVEENGSEASAANDNLDEPMVDVQATVDIEGVEEQDPMLDAVPTPLGLTAQNVSERQEAETFNITHRSPIDGSIINTNVTPTNTNMGFPPPPPPMHVVNLPQPAFVPPNVHTRNLLHQTTPPGIQAAMPRDEDVLMSLQLLAYVSKYCVLRTYFQESHLVPKLKIDPKFRPGLSSHKADEGVSAGGSTHLLDSELEEYLLPDDFNIFPLVEKFTVRHHSQDMRHWAGVVMRNLCRKDDSRGGIRQCAYYKCGKWEQWARQFAKCRRCRRTKYCSKECQKNAWFFHRHWCVVATQ
ncbi:MAG: hypothetical protein LQ342_002969 [Letrouitia transgressa]|nr:MAG: hypothetical protein LQ342_002969 [Letrouitia transgressa]